MTVEPPEERPLNLRDLAETHSPDVVRLAVRRFRRRTLIRGAWVAVLVLGALLVSPLLPIGRELLPEKYLSLPGVAVGRSASAGPIKVTVIDARRIDREHGAVHLLVETADGSEVMVRDIYKGTDATGERGDIHPTLFGRISEVFATVPLPFQERVITVSIVDLATNTDDPPVDIAIDLSGIRELESLWR